MGCLSNISASAVSAFADIGLLLLSATTLFLLFRDFYARYRPYVIALAEVSADTKNQNLLVFISPHNIGSHPCSFKLTNIKLQIGDEFYDTPHMGQWSLLSPNGVAFNMPAGYINISGVNKIRGRQFRSNRIEVSFKLHTKSIHNKYYTVINQAYEIDVNSETPIVLTRPEWTTQD